MKRPNLTRATGPGQIEAVATEIRLGAEPSRGFLGRKAKHPAGPSLLITKQMLVLEAGPVLRGRLEIGWDSIRKAVVDDGARWGHVARSCRFPVYDIRPDGSGSGTLIGPLWSLAASLMPPACPQLAIDPVPAEAPNIALIFEPLLATPPTGEEERVADGLAILLLRAKDPDSARPLLAEHAEMAELDHADLAYLEAVGEGRSAHGAGSAGEAVADSGQSA